MRAKSHTKAAVAFALSAIFIAHTASFGAEPTGQTVTSAARHERTLSATGALATVITPQEISAYGWRTIEEAVNGIRLFYLYPGLSGDRPIAGLSGLRPGIPEERIAVLLNGQRMNDFIYGYPSIGGASLVSIRDVKSIEIIRGPMSALYGGGAMLGVINIITKDGKEFSGIGLSGSRGTYGAGNERISYGTYGGSGDTLFLSYDASRTDGYSRTIPEYSGIADGIGGQKAARLFASGRSNGYFFDAGTIDHKAPLSLGSYGSIFDAEGSVEETSRDYMGLGYSGPLGDGREFRMAFNYDRMKLQRDLLVGFDENGVITSEQGLAEKRDVATSEAGGTVYGAEFTYSEPWMEHHFLTLGYEYIKHEEDRIRTFDTMRSLPWVDISESYKHWGAYVQDEYSLDALGFVMGIRYDGYPGIDKVESPRAAVIYKFENSSVGKVLWGKSFRPPNLEERLYFDNVSILRNNGLAPERAETYEAVWEQDIGKSVSVVVSFFETSLKGLITLQPVSDGGPYRYGNLDEAKIQGIQGEGNILTTLGGLRLSYLNQKARFKETGAEMPYTPEHSGRALFSSPFWGGALIAGIEADYTGGMLDYRGEEVSDSIITNLTLATGLAKGWILRGSVYNMFNRSNSFAPGAGDYPIALAPGPGRAYLAELGLTF